MSREGILAKLDFRYFFTMPLHVSSFMYFACSYHTLPKDIMFTSTPVKHFSSPINIPSTATSSYLLFISVEGKGYIISVFVHPVSLCAEPVMWPFLRHHGELILVMLVTRLQGTKKKKKKKKIRVLFCMNDYTQDRSEITSHLKLPKNQRLVNL